MSIIESINNLFSPKRRNINEEIEFLTERESEVKKETEALEEEADLVEKRKAIEESIRKYKSRQVKAIARMKDRS
jgi:hypothetical protein